MFRIYRDRAFHHPRRRFRDISVKGTKRLDVEVIPLQWDLVAVYYGMEFPHIFWINIMWFST